jgi:hypothetical protein
LNQKLQVLTLQLHVVPIKTMQAQGKQEEDTGTNGKALAYLKGSPTDCSFGNINPVWLGLVLAF